MTPKQRASKAKKAFDLFEQAYVLVEEMVREDGDGDWCDLWTAQMQACHEMMRTARRRYERDFKEIKGDDPYSGIDFLKSARDSAERAERYRIAKERAERDYIEYRAEEAKRRVD